MISEHDRIVLTEDLGAHRLKAGDVGVVVHVYQDGTAYEVEFMTLSGETLSVVTLGASQVRPVDAGDVLHARPLGAIDAPAA
jgi:hypothetical protein